MTMMCDDDDDDDGDDDDDDDDDSQMALYVGLPIVGHCDVVHGGPGC